MTQSETQERLKEIRERSESRRRVAAKFEWARVGLQQWGDIDFLLSLIDTRASVDSQGVDTLHRFTPNRNGVCVTCDKLKYWQYHIDEELETDAATQMRDACVETIRALRPSATGAGAFKDAAIKALGAVTLDQVKQKEQSK